MAATQHVERKSQAAKTSETRSKQNQPTRPKEKRRKSDKPIHVVRLQNLRNIIDKRFAGNSAECARAIKRPHTFMWQLLHNYRSIGEDTARLIEKHLQLAHGAMDLKAALERSDILIAHDGAGESQWYRMVPVKNLENMKARPRLWLPFPAHNASQDAFCVKVNTEVIDGLNLGDLAFADPQVTALENGCMYVVETKAWGQNVAGILVARKRTGTRWVMETTNKVRPRQREFYELDQARVIARVISIVRHLQPS